MANESRDASNVSESSELRAVNWRELLGFTHIFKSFRLSRHMTKIVIALLAVILTWGIGLGLDLIFTPGSDVYVGLIAPEPGPMAMSPGGFLARAGVNLEDAPRNYIVEPDAYWCKADFSAWRDKSKQGVQDAILVEANATKVGDKPLYDSPDKAKEAVKKDPGQVRSQLCDAFKKKTDQGLDKAKTDRDEAMKKAGEEKDETKNRDLKEKAQKDYDEAVRACNQKSITFAQNMNLLGNQGPFATFVNYEEHYFNQAVAAVLHGKILTGFNTIKNARDPSQQANVPPVGRLQAGESVAEDRARVTIDDPIGLLACLALMGYGILWFASAHWIYAIVLVLPLLLVWSIAGGAIARAAALQAARDEKAGIGECLKFGARKAISFLASPLVPVVVFLLIGLLSSVLPSLLGMIPGFGPIWIGATFGLVLIVAVLLAFLLIGLLAGGALMAPTVAVEGSDTFDACTRSYQFVLARPWRAALYGIVAAVYGSLCYVFVRFLLFLTLGVAHWIVSILYFCSGSEVRPGASRWDLMYPGPTFENFFPGKILPGNLTQFGGADWFGSMLVYLWVLLVTGILIAWVISYLFSASTMIYLLLRKAEDATDMKEIYVEEEPVEEPAPVPAAAAATSAAAPAAETPPAAASGDAPAGTPPTA
jgi:hypothetical protein